MAVTIYLYTFAEKSEDRLRSSIAQAGFAVLGHVFTLHYLCRQIAQQLASMRKLLFIVIAALVFVAAGYVGATVSTSAAALAKADSTQKSKPFKAYLENDEYKIYLRLNLYDKNIKVAGQDIYGELDGFIGSKQSSNVWLITSSEVKGDRTAEIEVINDFGSEDFTATLRVNADGTYTLKKHGGSTLKFAVRGKWQKLPGTIELKRK